MNEPNPSAPCPAKGAPSEALNEEATIVIFGASGDLTARKLIPALYQLAREGFLSAKSPIVGVARREKSEDEFRREMHDAVRDFGRDGLGNEDLWGSFARRLF